MQLPEPEICHSLLGLPVFVFSQATSLTTGASQGAAAAFGAGNATRRTRPKLSAKPAQSRRRSNSVGLSEDRENMPRHLSFWSRGYRGFNADILFARPRTQPTKSLRALPPQSRGESSTVSGFA